MLAAFFSHTPSPTLPGSESQVYILRILLVSDAALCICSSKDRTAATINYSVRTAMPQSVLGRLPVNRHRLFRNVHSFTTSDWKMIETGDDLWQTGERKQGLCCDCAKLKAHRPRPRNRHIFMSNMKRPQLCQMDKDRPGSQGLITHTANTHKAS